MTGRRRWVAGLIAVGAATILNVTPPTSARAADPGRLQGEGGSFDGPIINQLLVDGAPTVTPFIASYFDSNLDGGRDNFAAGIADFALSELPLTSAQAATAAKGGRDFAYVPLITSAVAIGATLVHQGVDSATPNPFYTGIRLRVATLASMFPTLPGPGHVHVQAWNDPPVLADNPGVTFDFQPNTVVLSNTVDPSEDTYGLISLFLRDSHANPIWNVAATALRLPQNTPLERFSTGISGGEQKVADFLIPVNPETGMQYPNPGRLPTLDGRQIAPIGVDWTTGGVRHIPTLAIENPAGSFVAATPEGIAAALSDATIDTATNLVTFNPNPNNATAYAIPALSYLVVPTKGLDPAKAKALAAFIRFVYSDPGAVDIKKFGAVPVTDQMKAAGLHVADLLQAEGSSDPASTTTSSSRPSSSTTATTARLAANRTGSVSSGGSGSTGGAAGQATSAATLPNTGQDSLPELAAGVALLVGGETVRRRLRSRSR